MSLVAYEYSSAEESEEEDNPQETNGAPKVPVKTNGIRNHQEPEESTEDFLKNHLHLPAPKKTNDLDVEEEDDEFLRKKAVPETSIPAKPNVRNGKVQITIPSMKDFKDVESDAAGTKKGKPVVGAALPKQFTNLLSLLPKPRTALFDKPVAGRGSATGNAASSSTGSTSFSKRLVPDSVANRPRSVPMSAAKVVERRTVPNDGKASTSQTGPIPSTHPMEDSDDEDDSEDVDFFSFNKVEALPAVSANEISAMVAKKAAKMAETVRKLAEPEEQNDAHIPGGADETSTQQSQETSQPSEDLANETALAALIGGNRAKRARVEQVDLIEITSADIVPSKEDFLRRQLQDETGYVPTGSLVGDWTCTSKRKSHITQLANKAQANAQELEAMWAANRQSRRQTQSKYGF
uniref:Proline-rich protein PRCC n=1 Tax=Anopheles atroparvus TaxID=41427 RepID=A0AAG5D486_ANOAO